MPTRGKDIGQGFPFFLTGQLVGPSGFAGQSVACVALTESYLCHSTVATVVAKRSGSEQTGAKQRKRGKDILTALCVPDRARMVSF